MGKCQGGGLGALIQHSTRIQPVTQLVPKGERGTFSIDENPVARVQVNDGARAQRFLQSTVDQGSAVLTAPLEEGHLVRYLDPYLSGRLL